MAQRTGFSPTTGLSDLARDILNPKKSVIVEMVMVQLISLCLIVLAVLVFKGDILDAATMSYMLVGAFSAATLAGTIYTRLSR